VRATTGKLWNGFALFRPHYRPSEGTERTGIIRCRRRRSRSGAPSTRVSRPTGDWTKPSTP
jgi:hypothetical protein